MRLGGARLRGCTACGDCGRNLNKRCVLEDDGFNEVFAKMLEADAILIGEAAYEWTLNHVIEVKNPMELFRTRFHTIEGARLKEAV